MKKKAIYSTLILLSAWTFSAQAQNNSTTLEISRPKKAINIEENMYGVFFEDINFAADGGLYAEKIKNRSFEFINSPLMGWTVYGPNEIRTDNPCFDRNPHYIRLTNKALRSGTGLVNEGFKGIGIEKEENYLIRFFARTVDTPEMKIAFEFINSDGSNTGKAEVIVDSKEWKEYKATIKSGKTDFYAKFRLNTRNEGTIDIDHISLFPEKTWKNRENGLRLDIAQALADLNPKLFRFPGGCIIEGNTLDTRYDWKKSVGPVENRPINENRWNYTFQHRFSPDYFQTYGLGFFEFFQFCEDIGADALPVVSCGIACQYESKEKVPFNELGSFVQDALDLIEFANGPVTSTWGKVRADMGHPAPFNLKMIGIGNEQWGEDFPKYLNEFIIAIRKEYPDIKIVGSSGPTPDGKDFDYLWKEMTRLGVDLVDEHYYRSPEWFLANARRYDNYDRKGPKVFAGEYACHVEKEGNRKNTFLSALCEAAFMTGLERNADVVHLASYAPLLAHADAWQWCPDMIWYDNLRCVKSANYYVQQLYMKYTGTEVWLATSNGAPLTGENGLFVSASNNAKTKQLIIKVANTSKTDQTLALDLGKISYASEAEQITLKADLDSDNTFDAPLTVAPKTKRITVEKENGRLMVEAESFNVFIIEIDNK